MSINVTIPDIYDNYRSEYVLPRQCRLDPTLDTKVTFRVTCGEMLFEIPQVALKMISSSSAFKLPILPKADPETVDVLFEYCKDVEGIPSVIENLKVAVKTSGYSWIPMGQETTADSVFIRMGLCVPSFMEEIRKSKEFSGMVGYGKENLFDPEAIDIGRMAGFILRYLSGFDKGESIRNGDLLYCSTIQDALETKKANPITRGLIFCHIAHNIGLYPVMAIFGERCVAGVKSCAMDLKPCELTKRKVSIEIKDEGLYSLGDTDGEFILFDMSETEDTLESADSALSIWNSSKCDVLCSVRYELEKDESIKMGIEI